MSDRATDLNLLFGMLANQLNFVTGQQLLEAMHLWAGDKSQALGSILVDQGWLAPDRRQLLDALVEEHLRDNNDDPARSLADVRPARETLDRLAEIDDDKVSQSLMPVKAMATQPPTDHDVVPPTMPPESASPQAGSRFRTVRLHDQGGIGKVWIAEDTELQRSVALKEIRNEYADDKSARDRFVLEAEITGGLEHPGVVPVYGLGKYADGRPYYAMRFIRGSSLRKCISDFHRTDWKQRGTGERTIELRRLLGCFLDTCHAIDYAHSRGVLHRDLKPANVMIGEYGETLVVDWGLAKLAGEENDADRDEPSMRPPLKPASMSVSNPTLLGSAIGSPSFMSPEQARGEHDQLGPETDIYGLGATLYVLLTNQTAFAGSDYIEVLDRVKHGEWVPPRTIKADVPKPLDAICCKAMQFKPEDRYSSAAELGKELERYLADEPVNAYREGAIERLMRLARRHRGIVRAAAAALLAVTAVSIGATFLINGQKRAAEQARQNTEDVLDYLVEAFKSPNPERKGREITIAEVLDQASEELDRQLLDDPLQQAKLADAIGRTYHGLGLYSESIDLHERSYRIRAEQLGATALPTLESKNELALACLNDGQTDRAIPLFVETLQQRQQQLPANHRHIAESQNNLGLAYVASGDRKQAIPLFEASLESRQLNPDENEFETINIMMNLYAAHAVEGELHVASDGLERTLKLAREKLGNKHRVVLSILNNLGYCYYQTGRIDEAVPLLEQAFAGRTDLLGATHPETIGTEGYLAIGYSELGRHELAVRHGAHAKMCGGDFVDIEGLLTLAAMSLQEMVANSDEADADGAVALREAIDAAMLDLDLLAAKEIDRAVELIESGDVDEAERMLLNATRALSPEQVPPAFHYRVGYLYQHLVTLYRGLDRDDEADRWQTKLDALKRL